MFKLTTYKAYHNWEEKPEIVASFFSLKEAKKCLKNVLVSKIIIFENLNEYNCLSSKSGEEIVNIIDASPEINHNETIFQTLLFEKNSNFLLNAPSFTNLDEANKFVKNGEIGVVQRKKLSNFIYKSFYDYKINEPDFNY